MLYQWVAVGLIVAVAAAYVVRQTIRTWSGSKKTGCGGGCGSGCGSAGATKTGTAVFVPAEHLTVRTSRER
jgi:hypothetical protein